MARRMVRVERTLFDPRLIFFIPLYLSAVNRFRLKKTLKRVIVSNDRSCYGYVNEDDTVLAIRLRQPLSKPGAKRKKFRRHRAPVLVDTLAHECAHLRYADHGPAHRALTYRILRFWATGKAARRG